MLSPFTAGFLVLPVGADEGQSTKGDVDSEVRTVAAITSLSAWPEGLLGKNKQSLATDEKKKLYLINCGPAATFAYKTQDIFEQAKLRLHCVLKCFILAERMESYFG